MSRTSSFTATLDLDMPETGFLPGLVEVEIEFDWDYDSGEPSNIRVWRNRLNLYPRMDPFDRATVEELVDDEIEAILSEEEAAHVQSVVDQRRGS